MTSGGIDGAHALAAIVAPIVPEALPWADEQAGVSLWMRDPGNPLLEYMAFRDLALARKRCLVSAQHLALRGSLQDMFEAKRYLALAERIEAHLNAMQALGSRWWTGSVDESIVPSWRASCDIMRRLTNLSIDECVDVCDGIQRASRLMRRGEAEARGEVDEWRAAAQSMLASHWDKAARNMRETK